VSQPDPQSGLLRDLAACRGQRDRMRVAIRTDASLSIGTGHVRRCLTLAAELRERGAEIHFLCTELPGNSIQEIADAGFRSIPLPEPLGGGVGTDEVHDAANTLVALEGLGRLDWMVVDHYSLGRSWEGVVRGTGVRVLAVDDIARPHDCDMILDQTAGSSESRYDGQVPDQAWRLIGSDFALVRGEFMRLRADARARRMEAGKAQTCLVNFGGSDQSGVIPLTIRALAGSGLRLAVVLGRASFQENEVHRALREAGLAGEVVGEVDDMPSRMLDADLSVGGGGTTSWERCCLGLPSVVVTVAENQETIARFLDQLGAGVYLGPAEVMEAPAGGRRLRRMVDRLVVDSRYRREMSLRAMSLIDGGGAARVARSMETF